MRACTQLSALTTMTMVLGACALGPKSDSTVIRPTEMPLVQAPRGNEGSLFAASSPSWSPWRDDTAHAVGDIVTVAVSVDRKAEESATTDLSRESKIKAGITSFFGLESKLPGIDGTDPLSNTTPGQLIDSESTSNFRGDGETTREGKVTARISAVVTHVYPNGNMRIHGSQILLVNNERSLLTVEGIIRQSDVSFDNMVNSSRIANAQIEITGRGVVSDKQRPGLFLRVFDWVWPL